MKKNELKLMIKECVREVLFEEGVLSDLIAEVSYGIVKAQNMLTEDNSQREQENAASQLKARQEAVAAEEERRRSQIRETKRKMLNAIGNSSMKNVFEGTEPLSNSPESSASSPMSGISPNDPGVDISGLFSLAGSKWNHLK